MDNPACYEIGVPSILCTRIRARIDPNLRVSTFVFRTVIPSGRSKMIAVENSKVFEIYWKGYFFFSDSFENDYGWKFEILDEDQMILYTRLVK